MSASSLATPERPAGAPASAPASAPGPARRPRRWHPWPLGIALGLGTAISINLVMVFIAHRSAPVMVESGDYYARAVAWQTEIDAARASAALGWQAEVELAPGEVRYRLSAAGRPVTGLTGHLVATRSDTARHDFDVALAEGPPGTYRAARPHTVGGLYRLVAQLAPPAPATAGGVTAPWLDERAVVLP